MIDVKLLCKEKSGHAEGLAQKAYGAGLRRQASSILVEDAYWFQHKAFMGRIHAPDDIGIVRV